MKRYNTYKDYLTGLYGEKVRKVMIDAGFTCPNKDGNRAFGGCTFCDAAGSGSSLIVSGLSVLEQVQHGIEQMKRDHVQKFIAYFQAFTNTYAPVEKLRELYAAAIEHPDVVGLAIGTRPDCLSDAVLDLLQEFQQKTQVWIEYGLQSRHNQTLEKLNRGHTAEEFEDAVIRSKERDIPVTAHLILGLPGETEEMMMESAQFVIDLNPHGIKIHNLYLEEGMPMTEAWRRGEFEMLSKEKYVELTCDIIEKLPPEMIVERVCGEPHPERAVAPDWALHKAPLLHEIEKELESRNSWQGKIYSSTLNAEKVV